MESLGHTAGSKNSQSADKVGDPVLVTTGRYILETEDFQIPGSDFAIKRSYLSDEFIVGSMGSGWRASVDSRMIRGVTRIDESVFAEIQELLDGLLDCHNELGELLESHDEK